MYTYHARSINVVDGDTLDCAIDLGFHMTATLRLRLEGIDCPESNSKDESERIQAQKAKIELANMVNGKKLTIQTNKSDMFGRWVALISCEHDGAWISVNQKLIDMGLAKVWVKK